MKKPDKNVMKSFSEFSDIIKYYDRQGNPMTLEEWASKFEDNAYKRVEDTHMPDGGWVSTVWLGTDHGFGDSIPVIFETMVFDGPHENEIQVRYHTEEEARAGHWKVVRELYPARVLVDGERMQYGGKMFDDDKQTTLSP